MKLFYILTSSLILCFSGFSQSKLMSEGITYFNKEDYNSALEKFEKEAHKKPTDETSFWIGSCQLKLEQFDLAKKSFLNIVYGHGKDSVLLSKTLVNLGSSYRMLNNIDSADYYYEEAIRLFPDMADAYFNRAQLYYGLSKFQEAKIFHEKAISLNNKDWYYYAKHEEICFILHDYEAAMNDILQIKRLNPKIDLRFNTAYCFSMTGKYEKADSLYKEIYNEKDAIFLNNYGFNKHNLGQSEEGIRLIKKSLELNPDNSYAYRNLAIISIDNKNLGDACTYLKKAKDLNFSKYYGSEVDDLLLENCK